MKYKIIQNKETKTITLALGELTFYNPKYLLEKKETNYFGTAIFDATNQEFNSLLTEIIEKINEITPESKITKGHLLKTEEIKFNLFGYRYDKEGNPIPKQKELSLSLYAPNRERQFFVNGIKDNTKITDEEFVKDHEWGIELELYSKINEDGVVKLYYIIHRIIKGKEIERKYKKNDDIWNGFNLEVEDKAVEEDDFPY